MTDVRIKNLKTVPTRASNDVLQDFHASLTPYIIRRADNCTTVMHSKVPTAAYPLRYAQVQEALNALRLQSCPFGGERQRTARTVSVVMAGNLYHALTTHCRIHIDPRQTLDDVLFIDDDTLNIISVSGFQHVFALAQLDAWRVDDSWTYIDEGTEERTLGHILNDIDVALQMPQGFDACLAQRQSYVGTRPSAQNSTECRLTALLDEYRTKLNEVEVAGYVAGRRVQIVPKDKSVTGCEGPCAFIDPDAALNDCIVLDDDYLRVNKIDGLPLIIRHGAINRYQIQDIRNVLSEEEYDGCSNTQVTIVEDHTL